jgi:hypothetical protein
MDLASIKLLVNGFEHPNNLTRGQRPATTLHERVSRLENLFPPFTAFKSDEFVHNHVSRKPVPLNLPILKLSTHFDSTEQHHCRIRISADRTTANHRLQAVLAQASCHSLAQQKLVFEICVRLFLNRRS